MSETTRIIIIALAMAGSTIVMCGGVAIMYLLQNRKHPQKPHSAHK